MANHLNSHFVTAGANISKSTEPVIEHHRLVFGPLEENPDLREISIDAVWELLCKLSPSKATGMDGIPACLIKACKESLLHPLHFTFNLSIRTDHFPNAWKGARVTALHKSRPHDQPDNYRPILVLLIFSKLLERCIHNQMYTELTILSTLCPHQFGFRKGHLTTTCLAEFLDVIYDNMNNGMVGRVLFLDLRKVFDTVDHHILLCKLEETGLGKRFIQYIENYLYGRSQITKIATTCSDPLPVTCGVPQGSILGPLLFIIYINSLPNCLPDHTKTFLYAGDTALVVNGSNATELNTKINESLELAGMWFRNHQLSLNVSKTKMMVFGTQQKVRSIGNDI